MGFSHHAQGQTALLQRVLPRGIGILRVLWLAECTLPFVDVAAQIHEQDDRVDGHGDAEDEELPEVEVSPTPLARLGRDIRGGFGRRQGCTAAHFGSLY